MTISIIAIIAIGLYFFLKIDTNDRKARKDAVKVTATISKLRCKQNLKGDKSLLKVSYQGKEYSVFFKGEKECSKYQLNQKVDAFYSKNFDKIFLEL